MKNSLSQTQVKDELAINQYAKSIYLQLRERKKTRITIFFIGIVTYFIVGLPLLDIEFLIYLIVLLVCTLIISFLMKPLDNLLLKKRHELNDDENEFDEWFGSNYYVFYNWFLVVILGILPALVFKFI